eukprot:GEMP01032502.1.p1 GENE.GEMP01032502.1~~GEMP01032502.1.p1  ORF type:complete len:521 (+),score=142.93 GEMP01032502.1:165-1727(+)
MSSARCSLTKEEIVESIVEDRRRLLKKRLREHGIRHGTINSQHYLRKRCGYLLYRKGLELRQRLKKEKEQVEIAECTFRPQIRRTMSSPFRPEAQKEHAERLHHEADLKNKMREKAKKLLELEQLASCPFTPKTCARSTSSPAPFFQRVDDGIKKQQQKVLQKQMEEELKHDFTFTPAISSRSEQIVQRKRSEAMRGMEDADILEPVENRLYNLQYRESRKVDQDNCPASGGAAHLAPKSEEIIKTSVYFQGPYKNFLHRQRAFQDAKEQRRECRLQNETPACPKEPIECIEGRMRRMGPEEHKQRMEKRRLKDVMWFEEECPFAPEINTNFRALGSEQHVFTRLNHKKETKHEPVEEPCSFQPAVDLSGRYAHVAAHYGRNVVSSQIKHDQHVRERKLDRIRVEESEKQTKDCTFHPTCGASPRNVQQPKIVNGLERFLELQKLARQQREERESTGSKSVDGYMGLTIPQPFRLSQNRKCRRSDIVEEDVKRNWDECTFRPDTIERQKRNLLRKILVSG